MALPRIPAPRRVENAGYNDHLVRLLADRITEIESRPGGSLHMVMNLKRVSAWREPVGVHLGSERLELTPDVLLSVAGGFVGN